MADDARPKKPPSGPTDVVLVHGPTDDGKGARVLRLRDDSLEAGEVRPLEDGKPIVGEVLKLSPREGEPRVCDVQVLANATPRAASERPTSKGPAQVASDDYRDNWGRIFGARDKPKTLH